MCEHHCIHATLSNDLTRTQILICFLAPLYETKLLQLFTAGCAFFHGLVLCLALLAVLFTDLLALLMPVGRDLPSHFRAGSQHTFEVLEELVALGILHAITYLYFGGIFCH